MINKLLRALRRLDWFIVFAVFLLIVLSFSALYSVELSRANEVSYIPKQAFALFLGLIVSIPILTMHYSGWRQLGRNIYFFGLIVLLLVLFFGVTIRGTTGWFSLFGFNFQPVELMKVAFAIQLARYFSLKAEYPITWRHILESGALLALPVLLIMMQPDLGSASILVGTWFFLLLFSGIRWYHLATFFTVGAGSTLIGWFFLLQEYQKDRIAVFLNPELDPLGAGYNVTQAKIAIGSGGLLGRGLGFGSQSQLKFLPEAQTDFIFSVISEELGFFGAALIIVAFGIILWRTLVIVKRSRDKFASFLALSLTSVLLVQMIINIGVNLTLLPTTGVALPFVSYGGSSLLISLIIITLLESIAIEQDPSDYLNRGEL